MEVTEHVDRSMVYDMEVKDAENAAEIDQVIEAIVSGEIHVCSLA